MGWLDSQFVFYASYHDNFVNQITHIIFVPLIVFSFCVLLGFTPSYGTWEFLGQEMPINFALFYACISAAYYAVLELPGFAGVLAGSLMMAAYIGASNLMKTYDANYCWNGGIFGVFFGFAAQIFTHQVFEKRSPALLDNIFQAFVMAPLFVVMETLFMFGYRPVFRADAQKMVDENIKAYRAKKVN